MEEAEKRNIVIRIIGAMAVRTHCPKFKHIEYEFGRVLTDIDFVAYTKARSSIAKLFGDLGYKEENKTVTRMYGRSVFHNAIHLDVFYDKLLFCHEVALKGKLEMDYPTIPLAELVLEKLQIVEINEKDIIDCICLLLEHDVGNSDNETINVKRIAKLFSNDWGWWRTGTMNLHNILKYSNYCDKLSTEEKTTVNKKVNSILDTLEKTPKSLKWKMRSKIGDKKKWYDDVEELVR